MFTYIPFGKMIEYSLYDRSYTKVRAFAQVDELVAYIKSHSVTCETDTEPGIR